LAAICRAADADARARKTIRAQTLRQRAQAVVTGRASATFNRNFANSALKIVMHNEAICGRGAKILKSCSYGLAGVVHGALGPEISYLQRIVDSCVA
jgi:hypothetical protein